MGVPPNPISKIIHLLRRLLSWRLVPPDKMVRPIRDQAVEGLRGVAALAVLYAHLTFNQPLVDPNYAPPALLGILNISHAAVLVFFVLSGYVIGLVTFEPATPFALRNYAWHRLRRLVPINTIAVGFGLIAGSGGEWAAGLANLFFAQNSDGYPGFSAPLLTANPNLWSLNYEMVLYTAFAALWVFRPRASIILFFCLTVAVATTLCTASFHFLGHWALGLIFWMSGLMLAWTRNPDVSTEHTSNWPAAVLAILATRHLNPLHSPLARLGLDSADSTSVVPADLAYLMPVLWLLAAVAGLSPRVQRTFAWLSCVPVLSICAWRLVHPYTLIAHSTWIGMIAAVIASMLIPFPIRRAHLSRLAPIGLISYALYALAGPIQHIVLALPFPSGSALTWFGRVVFVMALGMGAAYLCERSIPSLLGLFRASAKPVASP